jgi:hypothetical protein
MLPSQQKPATLVAEYDWKNLAAAVAPGDGYIGVVSNAQVCMSVLNRFGVDATAAITAILPGDEIYLQQRTSAAQWVSYTVNSVDAMGVWYSLPVTPLDLAVAGFSPKGNDDIEVLHVVVSPSIASTWITGSDLAEYLSADYTTLAAADQQRFDDRAAAASEWAYNRRAKYGYADDPVNVPSSPVREGTLMFGSILLRDQGAYDGALTFSDFASVNNTTGGSYGSVQRLLGVPRAVAV